MIGTCGWDYDAWSGSYYPDELPQDWRFGYYSNEYRSVLVPVDHWSGDTGGGPEDWIEDADPDFRFVLQLAIDLPSPDADVDGLLDNFLQTVTPLLAFTAGFLLTPSVKTIGYRRLEAIAINLSEQAPVCIDILASDETINPPQWMTRFNTGLCWYPQRSEMPLDGGAFMMAITDTEDAKQQREIIEKLGTWMERQSARAGLFFNNPSSAPKAAAQARIISELLGI